MSSQPWHRLTIEQATEQLGVDPVNGLEVAEADQRLKQYGPNRLAEKAKEPGWKAFLRQYRDLMQIILVVTALVSLLILRDYKTFLLLIVLTVFNAVLSLSQESKAQASLASLRSMMQLQARARRGGQVVMLPAEELVPGDIVMFEAGDKVPADGRLVEAATLEIEEARADRREHAGAQGHRCHRQGGCGAGRPVDLAFMNTTVTGGAA